ncbi:hypothetical protein [Lichenifustis flavocetrariae]|uniref:Uncharacterized protein n=1 Tax=Lichenifustis flavocetrariae TaxID=2949735 RepID=A0AA41Z1R9_9HYPH|nr:hypothetical protein [Lichenifustis flavocetrariae]MCW6512636.1 hypothetical protein [Lichenifustis flavocetrariae]
MATVAAHTSSKGARHAALALGIEGPTKERAMKAGTSFQTESTSRAVVVGADDAPRVERATDMRIRMTDNQFERLKRRCELSRNDPDMNRILAAAGFHYARLHYNAGMEALCGFDLSKGFTTARGQMSDAAAERKAQYLDAFRQADDMPSGALGFHALPRAIVVRKVILEDM